VARSRPALLAAVAVVPALAISFAQAPAPPPASLEEAYRANNIGVSLLEQFRHEEAAAAFRKALALAPSLGLARANLAIALLNEPKLDEAHAEAKAAVALLPGVAQPQYVLGLSARGLAATEEAQAAFRAVLAIDPQDVGALVNLAQLLLQERRYPEAIELLRTAVAAEPHNATAVYNLGLALVRSGQAAEGQTTMDRFRALKESGYGTLLATSYPEQGRYAEALASTGAEPDLVDTTTPAVVFEDVTPRWFEPPSSATRPAERRFAPGGMVTLADVDANARLDLISIGPEGFRLFLSDGARLVDSTAARGLDPTFQGIGAVAADVDNDTKADLLLLGPAGPRLWHNDGARFSDITAAAGLAGAGAAPSAALVDSDHDGDLDLLLAGSAPRLFQNDGSAKFKDVTAASGLAASPLASVAIVPTDFDNRRDVDLLLAGPTAVQLFKNERDGTFRDVAGPVGLGVVSAARTVSAGDINKDDAPDLVIGVEGGPTVLALSDGKARFAVGDAPDAARDARQVLLLDYDGDGLLDLVVLRRDGLRVLRNVGRGRWVDATATAVPAAAGQSAATVPVAMAAGDLDGDGHPDLVMRLTSGAPRVLASRGSTNHATSVRLAGLVSNRSGVGSKVTVRAGSLRQRLETSAATPPAAPADIVFGLGRREAADAVRVLWPAGILQTELPAAVAAPTRTTAMEIKELDRKPSSCPYLYAWNGREFAFVTDFMGGGEMGYWHGPGHYNSPDPDEYVRLSDHQLRPRDGRLELRVTNELEEALFVDHLSLLGVAHPADVEIYPDEGMRESAPRFRLVAVRKARPVLAATDDRGHDVQGRLAALDRLFVDGFPLRRIRGYAEEHSLTLDLGPAATDEAVLLLTGWTDYAFSSDNVAAHQAGLAMRPPALQVQDGTGAWQTVIEDLGIPVGRPQTLVVEMAGRWRSDARRIKIVTNMRIYWDEARVGVRTTLPGQPVRIEPLRADLRERGFSAEVSPDGRQPFGYDYARVSALSPWKVFPGRYTRTGDVRELLAAVDDAFVVSRPGDEVALSFDAAALPPLPDGWRRTYLLHSDGFSKEMDIHSATPDVLGPLPFHGMTRYPYAPPESYPMTAERRRLIERYNTRVVRSVEPRLEAAVR
jgi:hypothetical protein